MRVGQTATLETVADPGRKLKGRVAFIYPTFSPETRTLKVRFEFPNPGLRLKPQMYANVALDLHGVTGVVVPDSALIETGVRVIAFVDSGTGSFEPREVKVGVRGNGKAQILSGVKEGEKVAVGANFLLDSESKLRAALTKMTGGASAPPQSQSPPPPQTKPQTNPQPPRRRNRRGREITPVTGAGDESCTARVRPARPVKETFIQRIIGFCAVNRYMTLFAVSALCVFAVYTFKEIRLDALPDLSDTQVIVYSKWDRSPDIIEDQVTYPIVAALLGAPNVKAIRGFSDFGFSYVYVIFQDGTDIYWARSRVLEYLSKIQSRLPEGRADRAGAGRHGGGLDLPVRAGRPLRDAFARPAPLVPGLDAALRPPVRPRRRRGGVDRRLPEAVPGDGRPEQAGVLRHSAQHGHRSDPDVQQRGGRTPHRVRGRRIHGAGTRLYQEPVRPRKRGGEDGRRRRSPSSRRMSAMWRSAPRSGAASPTSTGWATTWAASW